jgi:hypothetical protein
MAIYELDRQRPELAARSWVAETAAVIRRVRLKADASVWFGSVLRGNNEWVELGERSQMKGTPAPMGPACSDSGSTPSPSPNAGSDDTASDLDCERLPPQRLLAHLFSQHEQNRHKFLLPSSHTQLALRRRS